MTVPQNFVYGNSIRKQIVKEIRDAYVAHEKWVRRAKHLVENLPVDEKMIPVDSTECQFGQWLYGNGMKYKNIAKLSDILHKIELEHRNLHDTYLRIYKIYFLETKRSWIMNLVTQSRKEVTPKKQQEALHYYHQMVKISTVLLESLEVLEASLVMQKDDVLLTFS
ncbi:MAG: CZB domain-containing protein [Sulfuricurvum sp.]|uniref:CZB domain-containing protein n=1 Tax=Sulfuricurvum sp. TaxID=2025608 RepID=UPI0026206299|nr:CZB domain-containing protein [Sulfuricurvum sp.]MDD2828492.1 CZB domain-containing protein [Sulfuricurvum sp.]MDD4948977.1 CZB domain-containing protein [Sulfuricurvum sp.]